MRTSEKNENILKAIAKIQSEMPLISKSGRNTFFKNTAHPEGAPYITLSDILEAAKPLEKASEISVLHYVRVEKEAEKYGVTRLFHSSGEWAELEVPLLISKNDMQGLKSAITYSKRANLEGFYNIEPEFDDDGNSTSTQANHKPKTSAAPQQFKHEPKKTQAVTAKTTTSKTDFNSYIIQFGKKMAGKKLTDFTVDDHIGMLTYLDNGVKNTGKPLSGKALEYYEIANAYVTSQLGEPPPKINDEETLPF